jgi:hypothetical protein
MSQRFVSMTVVNASTNTIIGTAGIRVETAVVRSDHDDYWYWQPQGSPGAVKCPKNCKASTVVACLVITDISVEYKNALAAQIACARGAQNDADASDMDWPQAQSGKASRYAYFEIPVTYPAGNGRLNLATGAGLQIGASRVRTRAGPKEAREKRRHAGLPAPLTC